MPQYNLRLLAPGHFAMGKFDSDFNVEAIYNLRAQGKGYLCDCPASARAVKLKPCKHQRMMQLMMGACNTERFFDPDKGLWSEPLRDFRNGDSDGLPEPQALDLGQIKQMAAMGVIPDNLVAAEPLPTAGVESLPTPPAPQPAPAAAGRPAGNPIITRRI